MLVLNLTLTQLIPLGDLSAFIHCESSKSYIRMQCSKMYKNVHKKITGCVMNSKVLLLVHTKVCLPFWAYWVEAVKKYKTVVIHL
jgi:hypothetical protein